MNLLNLSQIQIYVQLCMSNVPYENEMARYFFNWMKVTDF